MKQLRIELVGEQTEVCINLVQHDHRSLLEEYQQTISAELLSEPDVDDKNTASLEDAWYGAYVKEQFVDPFWERGRLAYELVGRSFSSRDAFRHALSQRRLLKDVSFFLDDEAVTVDESSVKFILTSFHTLYVRDTEMGLFSGKRTITGDEYIMTVKDDFDLNSLVFQYEDHGPYGVILKTIGSSQNFQLLDNGSYEIEKLDWFDLKYIPGPEISLKNV